MYFRFKYLYALFILCIVRLTKESHHCEPTDLPLSAERGFQFTEEEYEKFKIWPRGDIPYYIDSLSFDIGLQEKINEYLRTISAESSLTFIKLFHPPEDGNDRWLLFVNRQAALECVDYSPKNFTTEGVQRVILGYDCIATPKALGATVLALVGISPMHNSPYRDDYITVDMDNIIPEKRELFTALKNSEYLFQDIDYDFESAGHYNFYKYTYNGSATIIPKIPVSHAVGEGDGLSYMDRWKIAMFYNYISKDNHIESINCTQVFKPGKYFDPHRVEDKKRKSRKKPDDYLSEVGEPKLNKLNFETEAKKKKNLFRKLKDYCDSSDEEE